MLDLSNVSISDVIVHYIGNKLKSEQIIFSEDKTPVTKQLSQYLLNYIGNIFDDKVRYNFYHDTKLSLNEVYTYCKDIFQDSSSFITNSKNIATHLYNVSTHPNIKSGDLYILQVNNIKMDDKISNAIVLIKSENKSIFFKVKQESQKNILQYDIGMSINNVDKACLVFNYDFDQGYIVLSEDTNKNDSKYWKEIFLKLYSLNTNYTTTKQFIESYKAFVKNSSSKTPDQKITILNKSIDYFKGHEYFDINDFSNEVFNDPSDTQDLKNYLNQPDLDADSYHFPVSHKAVTEIKRTIRNYIKLDNNVEIKIGNNENRNLIEKGFDKEKHMNYYKIYFNEEK